MKPDVAYSTYTPVLVGESLRDTTETYIGEACRYSCSFGSPVRSSENHACPSAWVVVGVPCSVTTVLLACRCCQFLSTEKSFDRRMCKVSQERLEQNAINFSLYVSRNIQSKFGKSISKTYTYLKKRGEFWGTKSLVVCTISGMSELVICVNRWQHIRVALRAVLVYCRTTYCSFSSTRGRIIHRLKHGTVSVQFWMISVVRV